LNAPANSNEPKGWSVFWRWPVIAVFATLIFSLGVGAVWDHEYSLGACLLGAATVWTAAKAAETFGPFAATLLGSSLLILCFLWVQSRLDSTAEHHPSLPQANAPQAPLITWKPPSSIQAGVPLSEKQLNASASFAGKPVDGTFVYYPAHGATLPVGSATLSVTFYPTDLTKYSAKGQTVTLIVGQPKAQVSPPKTVVEVARLLTNDELRRKVKDLSDSMRVFELNTRQTMSALEYQPFPLKNGSVDQDAFRSRMIQQGNLSAIEQTEFRQRYLADSVTYKSEMLRRLNEMPPDREKQVRFALQGFLAGPSPIADLADYLEWLSKQLPQ
jgi:hypothetical protein